RPLPPFPTRRSSDLCAGSPDCPVRPYKNQPYCAMHRHLQNGPSKVAGGVSATPATDNVTVTALAQRVEATTGPALEEFSHYYRDYSSLADGVRCETGPAMRAHFTAVQALGARLSDEFDLLAAESGLDVEGQRIADEEDEFIAQTREDLQDFKARI